MTFLREVKEVNMTEVGPVFKQWTDKIDREKLTPMMLQYVEQKEQWPDCLLFFRLGDFYELFFDDAIVAAEALEITLTSRDCGLEERAPMCGVPHHAVDNYLAKLMDQNFKVAICEQMEDPSVAKGLVKRQVVKVVTPGTVTDLEHLDDKRNNFLVSVFQIQNYYGFAALDLMTGSFEATSINYGMTQDKVISEIERFAPAEILANKIFSQSDAAKQICARRPISITELPESAFEASIWQSYIGEKADAHDLWAKSAAGLLHYVKKTQLQIPDHVEAVERYDIARQLHLDVAARRNLELTETLRDHSRKGSLLWTIDRTNTSMGGRLLRRWLEQPLIDPRDIELRQDAVAAFYDSFIQRQELRERLRGMTDLERLTGKLSLGNVNARDLLALGNTLAKLPDIKETVATLDALYIKQLNEVILPMSELADLLERGINPEPPIGLKDGGLIKAGFNEEIDRLREADQNGRQWILDLEQRERELTGIKNLKVGYNRVFGYYLEVTKSNLNAVPDHYIRKQTLTNSERFYTEELKGMEDSILGAKQRVIDVEYDVFCQHRDEAKSYVTVLRRIANVLATLDALQGLAEQADRANYCRPVVDSNDVIAIKNGRHPVVERMLGPGAFVPNDTAIDRGDNRLLLITGPNMAGKSTYMRQVAQIVLLAQMGSFVPAESAHIGVVDGIFTRVGASDDLAGGDSTFMVEMKEVAVILKEATPRSLLILDEIGRGTSTFDGLAIAWAVMEAISDPQRLGCRTLFATHYHELTDLEDTVQGLKNYHVAVERQKHDITFLHRIEQGATDDSYGVEVAKLAGVPAPVVTRARELLQTLEASGKGDVRRRMRQSARPMDGQMDLFSSSLSLRSYDEIIELLKEVDIQTLTPLDALNKLYELHRKAIQIDKESGDEPN